MRTEVSGETEEAPDHGRIASSIATGPDAAPRDERWRIWSSRTLIGVALVLAGFSLLQLVMMRFGRDQGIYATVAREIWHGGLPYRDAWDFKPPGIFFVYALARLVPSPPEWGIRLLEAACAASLLPAAATLSKRFLGDQRPGLLGGGLAILVHSQLEFWQTAQPETFGGVAVIWAVVLLSVDRVDSPRRVGSLACRGAAGLLAGVAGLMKPHLAASVAPGVLYAVGRMRARGARPAAWLTLATVAVGGAVLPIVTCIGWFWIRGGWPDLQDALFGFAPAYVGRTWSWTRSWQRTTSLLGAPESERDALEASLYTVGHADYGANVALTRWLQKNTSKECTIHIYGFEPGIYVLADRRQASRYIYNMPQRVDWSRTVARPQLMEDLRRTVPEVIAVQHGDMLALVTEGRGDSAASLQGFDALRAFLDEQYVSSGRVASFDIYRHRER